WFNEGDQPVELATIEDQLTAGSEATQSASWPVFIDVDLSILRRVSPRWFSQSLEGNGRGRAPRRYQEHNAERGRHLIHARFTLTFSYAPHVLVSVTLNLPRFGGHPRSHGSAVGVCHGQTQAAGIHEGVQGAGYPDRSGGR